MCTTMNILVVFIVFSVAVEWTHGTSPQLCPNELEVYSSCIELTCETRHQQQNCSSQNLSCICKFGYVRDGAGYCIPEDNCNSCPKNEKYVNCVDRYCRVKTCDQLGYPLECPDVKEESKGGCVCIDGYVRNGTETCIPQVQCPSCGGDENARAGCGTHCGNSCSDYKLRPVILCPAILCTPNPNICLCRNGYVYDASIKKCVLPENCPEQECGENEYYDKYEKCCICNDGYEKRNKVCVKKCGKHEHYTNCINKCPKLPKGAVCRIKCLPGCACNEGYSRRGGVCTKINCTNHEHYSPCINPCPKGAQCIIGCIEGCLCNEGYIRKGNACVRDCVSTIETASNHESSSAFKSSSEESNNSDITKHGDTTVVETSEDDQNSASRTTITQDCGPLEDYLEDTNECHRSCADLHPSAPLSQCSTSSSCFCKPGYVRRDRNGMGPCVPIDNCPTSD